MFDKLKKLFTINSIKRRIQFAFLSLILLLCFSGAMSLFELERVSHDTEEILLASKQNVDLASDMITALNEQNDAMIYMAVIGGGLSDIAPHFRECESSIKHLSLAVERAHTSMSNTETPMATDSLVMFTNRINAMAKAYINGEIHGAIAADSLGYETTHSWYVESYKPEYVNVSKQITKYMTGSESTLGPDVNRLSHTARRAVVPVFIALVVMLVVVLMFYFFLRHYFVKPVLRINNALGDYLRYRIPFDENIACRDEIRTLHDRIITLISKLR
ncbi:MAG: hypothetical protein IJX40_00715 [Alistipes sp.]|nr:hypothetical protein [Alistipes sp.]